jgi:hypothetical protein
MNYKYLRLSGVWHDVFLFLHAESLKIESLQLQILFNSIEKSKFHRMLR